MRNDTTYRYEEVAGFITTLIDNGTLQPGARAPSLRQVCKQKQASLSTALQAYRLLEDRGVLEARPQSGFYVTRSSADALATPSVTRPPAKATSVSIRGIVVKLLEYATNPALVPLG